MNDTPVLRKKIMDIFDEAIIRSNNAICLNIDNADAVPAEVLALNVLSQLRNLVEAIIRKEYSLEHSTDLGHQSLKSALKFVKAQGKYAFLTRFHKKLEVTDSHLTVEPDAALRLMWRYYDYLLKCRSFVKKAFDLDILNNLEKFPQQEDSTFHEYYNKIAFEVKQYPIVNINESPTNRFRDQFFSSQNEHLSYLYFHYKSIPFDVMPFANSLHNHNTDLADLLSIISLF